MKVVCSICLEEMHENSCWVAMRSCGHVFDRTCISLVLNNGQRKCPLCNASTESCRGHDIVSNQIFPSKGNSDKSEEHTKLKTELDEANQIVASLQPKLAETEIALDSSCQEHGIALSKLENTLEPLSQLKMDNERLKRSNDDYLLGIDKLKTSYQIVANSFKRSPHTGQQTLGEQFSFQDFVKVGKNVLSVVSSDPSNSLENQNLQRDYLDLKKKYQDIVSREQLVEKKVTDLILRMQNSQAAENSEDRRRLQKQLFDALVEQDNLSNTVTNLNLEQQRILDEKRALRGKYKVTLVDNKKLQDTETTWITNNRHLQELLKTSSDDITNVKELNHDYTTEMSSLKEKIKALREAATKHDAESHKYAEDIKHYKEKIRALFDRESKLTGALNVAQQSWYLFI